MNYELHVDQSLGKNVRRIFRGQIDGALAVARGTAEPDDTPVHSMRKHLKKARAILQLVRKEIGRAAFRRQDRRLRDVGRFMTEIRDAEVRLQTMRQLEDVTQHHYRSYQKIERLLAAELENFVAAFDGWEDQSVALLDKARAATRKWPVGKYTSRRLRRAVQRTYKHTGDALAKAKSEPLARNLHALRKEVKLLGYQMRILRPLNPIVVSALSGELTQLGHLLGRVHDLTFLAEWLRCQRSESHWGKQDDALLAVIETSETELQRDGIEIAERFLAEDRAKFGARIAKWIDKWPRTRANPAAEALIRSPVSRCAQIAGKT